MIRILRNITKGEVYRSGRRNSFVMPVAMMVIAVLAGQAFWLSRNSHMFAPFEVIRIDCDHCTKFGTVRDPDNPRIRAMCPVCFGVGYTSVRRFDELDVVCLACGGMGRIDDQEDGTWRTCRRCDGRGLHRANDWQEIIEVEEADLEAMETGSNVQHSTFNNQHADGEEATAAPPDASVPSEP